MRLKTRLLAATAAAGLLGTAAACGGTSAAGSSGGSKNGSVTIYSADGLADWYNPEFKAFTKKTGIAVQYVEAGSGEVVSRAQKEKSNPQADVLVTLPPFIQKAASVGLLQSSGVDTSHIPAAAKDPKGQWISLVNNYLDFIDSSKASPEPKNWDDLTNPRLKGKLQYSTPGQAGDGTAVLIQLQHVFGKQGALDYLARLEKNNVGPSSSTGALQPKVSKGDLLVANGDVQMNLASIKDGQCTCRVFFPADAKGVKSTFALPYDIGLVNNAPHKDKGKQLIDFLLSQQAQQTVSSVAFGIPVRDDVHPSDANYAEVKKAMDGVTVWEPDWNQIFGSLDGDVAAYQKAVGG